MKKSFNNKNLNDPLITIITASYNSVKTIERTIRSVIDQNTSNIEFMVIDNNSLDGTVDVIKEYSNHIDFWVSESDSGIYDAWNKGIEKSNGKFIAFLGSDDILTADYYRLFYQKILENPDIDYISSRMYINDTNTVFGSPWEWLSFRKQMHVVHPGSLHNKSLFVKYGCFNNNFKIAGDYEFLLRIGANLKAAFIDKPTVIFCTNGVSSKHVFRCSREVRIAKISSKSQNIFLINIDYMKRVLLGIGSYVPRLFFKKG